MGCACIDPPVGDGEEEVDAEKKPTVATNRRYKRKLIMKISTIEEIGANESEVEEKGVDMRFTPSMCVTQLIIHHAAPAAPPLNYFDSVVLRLGYSYGAETSGGGSSFSLSPSSHQGHWCEEDKLYPLKKKRESFTCKLRPSMASVVEEQKKCIRDTPRNTEKSSVEYDL
ncbi:hypothetical protein RHMOL_Rhmol03G0005900 [Rhododendron molle]|uniref:Uncharacterized protein n=1 Tax=Rhododendron molle TaxID=49168 RepID=A0ACC0P9G0_RHOML|nr:hypothetical protein RHMOL_Rhmol03G0005900 [Rhododendron molle]